MRIRPQFSLATLLVAVSIVALCIGLLKWDVRRYKDDATHDAQLAELVSAAGGRVETCQIVCNPITLQFLTPDDLNRVHTVLFIWDRFVPKPLPLPDPAGVEHLQHFNSLECVVLQGDQFTGRDVSLLSQISTIRQVGIYGARVTDEDMATLATLDHLTDLWVVNVPSITGDFLSAFVPCKNLRRVDVSCWSVSDAAVARFRTARPDVQLNIAAFEL